ncbi:MAG: serine O-acetyltransferase [Lachnospiraceae bacterium]|jgi:serine O-acetyltransferase
MFQFLYMLSPSFRRYYKSQIPLVRAKDPAIKEDKEVLLYPSFWAVYWYRKAHKFYEKGEFYKARKISQKAARKTSIEIHPGAQIGEDFFIDHGHGVVIGETAIIGDDVILYQGVTLGGTGKEQGKRHPTLGSHVFVGAGAKVLGSITIGDNVKIGAGSVVLHDVPSNSTVVGVPGRVVMGAHVDADDLNQSNLPDPVMSEINNLRQENARLKNRLYCLDNIVIGSQDMEKAQERLKQRKEQMADKTADKNKRQDMQKPEEEK